MKLGAGLQACGALDAPPHLPGLLWSPAQPGPQPPNTFHRGRLLRAYTGRGRAAEPGTQGAWERSTRKEPHGHLGPVKPLAWRSLLSILPITLCSNSALSRHSAIYHPHKPGVPNRCQHTSRHTRTHTNIYAYHLPRTYTFAHKHRSTCTYRHTHINACRYDLCIQ